MSIDPKDLLAQALRMTPEARLALAHELLDSIDPVDSSELESDPGWSDEIERRVGELHSSTAKTVPASEVRSRAADLFQHSRGS